MLAQLLSGEVFAGMLVFARIGAAVMLLPGFGESYVLPRIRLAVALALTVVLFPLVRDGLPALPATPLGLFTLLGGEIVVGLFLGGVARLVMSALHVAGTVISFLSGLSYAQTVDPTQGTQGALFASLLSLAGLTIVFSSGLHLLLIAALGDSYVLFPAGAPPPLGDFAQLAGQVVGGAFAIGVQIAAPFVVVGMVFYIGLGILQRLMPQLQLFFVAIPVQMVMAFFLLTVVIGATMMVFLDHFATTTNRLLNAG